MDQFFAWIKEYKEIIIGITTVLGGLLWIIKYFLDKKKAKEKEAKETEARNAATSSAETLAGTNATSGAHSPINHVGTINYTPGIPVEMYNDAHAKLVLAVHELEKTKSELEKTQGQLLKEKLRHEQIEKLMPIAERLDYLTNPRTKLTQREAAHIPLLYQMMREMTREAREQ